MRGLLVLACVIGVVGCSDSTPVFHWGPYCTVDRVDTPSFQPTWTACDPSWPAGCTQLVTPPRAGVQATGWSGTDGRFELWFPSADTARWTIVLSGTDRTLVELRFWLNRDERYSAECGLAAVAFGEGRTWFEIRRSADTAPSPPQNRDVYVTTDDDLATSLPTPLETGTTFPAQARSVQVSATTWAWATTGTPVQEPFFSASGIADFTQGPIALVGDDLFWTTTGFYGAQLKHATPTSTVPDTLHRPPTGTMVTDVVATPTDIAWRELTTTTAELWASPFATTEATFAARQVTTHGVPTSPDAVGKLGDSIYAVVDPNAHVLLLVRLADGGEKLLALPGAVTATVAWIGAGEVALNLGSTIVRFPIDAVPSA